MRQRWEVSVNFTIVFPSSSLTCHWCLRNLDHLTLFQNSAGNPIQAISRVLHEQRFSASSIFSWLMNPKEAAILCPDFHSCWGWPEAYGHQRKASPACNICLEVINFLCLISSALLMAPRSGFCHYRSFWHHFSSSQGLVKSFWSHRVTKMTLENNVGFTHHFCRVLHIRIKSWVLWHSGVVEVR